MTSAHDHDSLDACWTHIGVQGDRSCPRLQEHAHCRNCDVFAAAAGDVMRRALPAGYLQEWSAHFAQPQKQTRLADRAALVFRIGAEWLALPAASALLAAEPRAARRLPHRREQALLGLVNLRGALYPCVSLARLMGIDEQSGPDARSWPRLLAVRFAEFDAALPVDELLGVQRYGDADLEPAPAAVAAAVPAYIQAVLPMGERRVGMLDAALLGRELARRIK